MKLFQKQLILCSFFFVILFGPAAYFSFNGVTEITARQNAQLSLSLADDFRTAITTNGIPESPDRKRVFSTEQTAALRSALGEISLRRNEVEDFFLLDSSRVVFTLNPGRTDSTYSTLDDSLAEGDEIALADMGNDGLIQAYWRQPLHDSVYDARLFLDPNSGISDILHRFTMEFYLLGFGGLLAAVFVAMIAAKVVRFPLRDIERAMQNIVRRKYGYRLRVNRNSEFHEVYEDVNKALERLEQLDSTQRAAMRIRNALQSDMKTLTKFLDIMAHEIKNPLHSFGINLDVLKTKIDKDLPKADYIKHVKILEREAEHLQEIIEGFLTYARPGVPRRERSKMNMIIKNVCQMAAAEAKMRNIKLETRLARSLPDVMIDRKQIQQALHNIVINAVHASNDGGKISIRSWMNRNRVMVAVKDTGSGIPKEQLEKIFDLYFTTKKDGSGIGLPVTKRMVESNSGQIKFESKVGKGTEVNLSFPGV